ncbi:MAG TPA: hypothetical protein VGG39_26780 [Polyangiaceae bacterium]|jgi:hypothetical protein
MPFYHPSDDEPQRSWTFTPDRWMPDNEIEVQEEKSIAIVRRVEVHPHLRKGLPRGWFYNLLDALERSFARVGHRLPNGETQARLTKRGITRITYEGIGSDDPLEFWWRP